MPLTVLLADDHQIVRRSLRRLIQDDERFDVIAEAATGSEAVRVCIDTQPDVVVLDINMPGASGISAAAEIKRRSPDTGVVMLTFQLQLDSIRASLATGAEGYVLKDSSEWELFEAIVCAAEGRRYIAQSAAEMVAETFVFLGNSDAQNPAVTAGPDPLRSLSTRERQVLQMLAEGTPNRGIADALNLSAKTVETYRSRLIQKLGVSSFAELVRVAVRAGLVDREG